MKASELDNKADAYVKEHFVSGAAEEQGAAYVAGYRAALEDIKEKALEKTWWATHDARQLKLICTVEDEHEGE